METLPYIITYTNNVYKIKVIGFVSIYIFDYPKEVMKLQTVPTSNDLFYVGSEERKLTLDYRQCTNLPNGTREILLDAIIGLATNPALGSVTISGQPVSILITGQPLEVVQSKKQIWEVYALDRTVTSLVSTGFMLRPGPNISVKLLSLTMTTTTPVSASNRITISKNVILTGTTWLPIAALPSSQMERTTTGSIAGGGEVVGVYYWTTQMLVNLSDYNIIFGPQETILIGIGQVGTGSTTCSIQWAEY